MIEEDPESADAPPPGASPAAPEIPPPQVQIPFPGFLLGQVPQIQQVQQVQVWQGQFPPPEAIERYVAVQSDSFDRIIRMAERQQDATIQSTQRAMELQAKDTRRGHVLGAAVTICAIAGAVITSYQHSIAVAIALVGVPVMTVAKALVDSVTINRQAALQAKAMESVPQTPQAG